MMANRFVWEIGVEEIPSQYVRAIMDDLGIRVAAALERARIGSAAPHVAATPRRLVVWGEVAPEQASTVTRVRGPSLDHAYREGEPTSALQGFLKRVGVGRDALKTVEEKGRTYVLAEVAEPVQTAAEALVAALAQAFSELKLPRSMRWGEGRHRFIRPVRWTLLYLEDQPLTLEVAGVLAAPRTHGNRTDHPEALDVSGYDDYWRALDRGRVMLDPNARAADIRQRGSDLARSVDGAMGDDPGLLDEVTALVEWPTPFLGRFDESFLAVPHPVLVTAMRVHQRYFPVYGSGGALSPHFVGVRNGVGEALDQVRRGNEKVLRARLKDAEYFYREDLKHPLGELQAGLEHVVFQEKLGSYGDKVRRICTQIADWITWWPDLDRAALNRAAALAKADLLTHVVQEFPELEGVMGAIYARAGGEAKAVADAVGEQYLPRAQGDPIPRTRLGQALGLLDRLDTLAASFGHGIRPTGSEDPFGLRRAGFGVARILTEGGLPPALPLKRVIGGAVAAAGVNAAVTDDIFQFLVERTISLWEGRFPSGWIAMVAKQSDRAGEWRARLEQVRQWSQTPGWEEYLAVCKRVDRVLPKDAAAETGISGALPEEDALARALAAVPADPQRWWAELPAVTLAVNRLFDAAMILDPDPKVRRRRVGLLARARDVLRLHLEPSML